MDSRTFVALLQFSDGLLPIGSYAHSFGLETYTAAGSIRDAEALESFLRAHLYGAIAPTDLVAALATRRESKCGDDQAIAACLRIDAMLDAMKPAAETRDASRQMGRQILRIAANLGDSLISCGLAQHLNRAVESNETPGHHAMAFGVVSAVLEWDERDMASAYLYSSCAGLVTAALRLMPLGQLTGQRVLWKLGPAIAQLAEAALGKDMEDIWSFAPGLEIAAMRHATLDARLFRS